MKAMTFADEFRAESERLTRRMLYHSIKGRALSADEAQEACRLATESVERETQNKPGDTHVETT